MREIKFRGRPLPREQLFGEKKLVSGGYWHDGKYHYILSGMEAYSCHPESIVQLLGIDKNGEEVYERDKLTDGHRMWQGRLRDYEKVVKGKAWKWGK